MMKSILFSIVTCLIFISCSSESVEEDSLLSKTIRSLKVLPDSTQKVPGYLAEWIAPGDVENLKAYHLWLVFKDSDSELLRSGEVTPEDQKDGDAWKYFGPLEERDTKNEIKSSFFLGDSLFEPYRKLKQDSVIVVAWAEHFSGSPGIAVQTVVYLKDVFPADPVELDVVPGPTSLTVEFERPKDIVSLIPYDDRGLIFGYNVSLKILSSKATFSDDLSMNWFFGKFYPDQYAIPLDKDSLSVDALVKREGTEKERHWFLYDGKNLNTPLFFKIEGLSLLTEFELTVETVDLFGNTQLFDGKKVGEVDRIVSTTTAEPPLLSDSIKIVGTIPGQAIIEWQRAKLSNLNSSAALIDFYQFNILWLETGDTLSQKRFVSLEEQTEFLLTDSLNYVFAGQEVQVEYFAVDKSGHRSAKDTLKTVIPGSAGNCPKGYVRNGGGCMGVFEASDSLGFLVNLRAEQAQEHCQSTAPAGYVGDLCTEGDWVSACEYSGFDNDFLSHGILVLGDFESVADKQSQLDFLLFQYCGLGSGDSLGANSKKERSVFCSNGAGVRDLSGQLQEWVLREEGLDTKYAIKGAGYRKATGEGLDGLRSLAECRSTSYGVAQSWTISVWPRDTLYLVNGFVVADTSEFYDEEFVDRMLTEEDYETELVVYEVYDGEAFLGKDTLNQSLVKSDEGYLEGRAGGYEYREIETLKVYLHASKQVPQVDFYRSPQVGFRCCIQAEK